MKKSIVIIMSALMLTPTTATVDRIENDIASIEVCHREELKMAYVPTEDFLVPITEGIKLNIQQSIGKFAANGHLDVDGNIYYQFKSDDDTVWWALTEQDLGFIPKGNQKYTLVYHNNGTTDCTECPTEFECECEVYDDVFLAMFEGGN